jgi:hypothetical protein
MAFVIFGVLIAIGPIFTVWSIQVLFRSEKLELNFESWCAALWVIFILNSIRLGIKKD